MNTNYIEFKEYRKDPHLDFLEYCTEEELQSLARLMTHDDDEKSRSTSSILDNKQFRELKGDPLQYKKCWQLIAADLQHFGGNTLVNLSRRKGVLYVEILSDVCAQCKVKYEDANDVSATENKLITELTTASFDKMTEIEKDAFLRSVGLTAGLRGSAANTAIASLVGSGYSLAALLYTLFGQTLIRYAAAGIAAQIGLRAALPWAGPIGIAIGTLLVVPMLTGPAYRVTIPAVLHIASLRQQHLTRPRF